MLITFLDTSYRYTMAVSEGADILNLQYVADIARDHLTDMLSETDGSKDVVIQSELMSLLNHVTPFSFLKKYA